MEKREKIIIVGAGFAGLQAAFSLNKKLGKKADVKVLDKSDCCVYTPELYQYLIGQEKKEDIAFDLKTKLEKKGIEFKQEKLKKIDFAKRNVKTNEDSHKYDYLIFSIGAEVKYLGIKGVENAVGFKTIGHANTIKEKISQLGKNNKINIIGSGLIAVELACFLKKYYKNSEMPDISLLGKEFMPGFNEKVKAKVKKDLGKKGIKFIEDCMVEEIEEEKVKYKIKKAHKSVKSNLTIMSTGFKIPEIAKNLGLEHNNQGIKVNDYFETSEINVYSIGDCSYLRQGGEAEKKRAQTAEKEGKHLAENIVRKIDGREMKPYEIEKIPTVISTHPTFIFNYGSFVMKNKLVNLLEKFIKIKGMF